MARTSLWSPPCLLAALLAACSDGSPATDAAADLTAADAAPTYATPSIDGVFEDWARVPTLATDPAGDASGGLDLRALQAAGDGTTLYLRLTLAKALNAYAGPASEGTLRLEIALPKSRLTVDWRGRSAYRDGDSTKTLRWSELGYVSAPTFASVDFELRLDLGRLGARLGDEVRITTSGSDALSSPARITLGRVGAKPSLRALAREAGTTVRIASLNTWVDGLTDSARQAAIGRLLKAAAADVYCFQELLATTDAQVASRLKEIDPHGDGAGWNVSKRSDLALASRGTLVPVPEQSLSQMFAGVALELSGKKLVVFTVRTTCCGTADSAADQSRVQEMGELAQAIAKLRAGQLGSALLPWRDAPLVVIGDWNLVGSRKPLDVMLAASGPALSQWMLRHLLVDDAFTWRSDKAGEFPPGMLDLLAHGGQGLTRRNGFVLDTRDLDAATLGKLGLQSADSLASDHLLLVGDFEIK